MRTKRLPWRQKLDVTALSACWRPAVDHYHIQLSLSAPQIDKVTLLEHLTVVANHLGNVDRIVPTVFGTDVIDFAIVFLAVWQLF